MWGALGGDVCSQPCPLSLHGFGQLPAPDPDHQLDLLAACAGVGCYSASHPFEQMIWVSHVLYSFYLLKLMVNQKLKVLLFNDADLHT